jgi:hypothetical protein
LDIGVLGFRIGDRKWELQNGRLKIGDWRLEIED